MSFIDELKILELSNWKVVRGLNGRTQSKSDGSLPQALMLSENERKPIFEILDSFYRLCHH